MNPETILDIYRRAWMLLGVAEKLSVIDALNEMDECTTASRALLEDFVEWCRWSDDVEPLTEDSED